MFKSLLENYGKKFLMAALGIVVTAAIAIINAKFGLNLPTPEVLAPAAGSIAYVIMQAIVDAATKGVTSSLKGTPAAPANEPMPAPVVFSEKTVVVTDDPDKIRNSDQGG